MDWLTGSSAPAAKKPLKAYGSKQTTTFLPSSTSQPLCALASLPSNAPTTTTAAALTLEEDLPALPTQSLFERLLTGSGDASSLLSSVAAAPPPALAAPRRKARPLLKARLAAALVERETSQALESALASTRVAVRRKKAAGGVSFGGGSAAASSDEEAPVAPHFGGVGVGEEEEGEGSAGGASEGVGHASAASRSAMRSAYRRLTMAPLALCRLQPVAASEEPLPAASATAAATVAVAAAAVATATAAVTAPAIEGGSAPPPPPPPPPPAAQPTFPTSLLPALLEFLPSRHLLLTTPQVSRQWALASSHVLSWRVATGMHVAGARESLCDPWATQPATTTTTTSKSRAAKARAQPAPPPPTSTTLTAQRAAPLLTSWAPFLEAFPQGAFLSSGAYKSVYRVWVAARGRYEAVAVMDCAQLARVGALGVVEAEIQTGCLLTQVLQSGACEHYVESYGVFLHAAGPGDFAAAWGQGLGLGQQGAFCPALPSPAAARAVVAAAAAASSTTTTAAAAPPPLLALATAALQQCARTHPRSPPPRLLSRGSQYQYTRMELCSGGDAEAWVRQAAWQAGGASSSSSSSASAGSSQHIEGALFQMVFALYVARQRIRLLHYDLKLLNFFVVPLPPAAAPRLLRYRVEGVARSLRLAPGGAGCSALYKLADYGTAKTSGGESVAAGSSSGSGMRLHHWSTLENAPPEFFLLGDRAVAASYAVDTWALGLCGLHLMMGGGPYEEALAGLTAPPPLRRALLAAWQDPAAPYTVIRKLLALDASSSGSSGSDSDSTAAILADTLYRYAVLLGGSAGFAAAVGAAGTPAAAALAAYCRPATGAFREHCKAYRWESGSHAALVGARGRVSPGLASLVVGGLLAWQPERRLSMRQALLAECFEGLQAEEGEGERVTVFDSFAVAGAQADL